MQQHCQDGPPNRWTQRAQMTTQSVRDICTHAFTNPVSRCQKFSLSKRWRSGSTAFPLNLHRDPFYSLSFSLKCFLPYVIKSCSSRLVFDYICFGWTFGSTALFLPPSPRRQVDVSAFSESVTWWRNQAAGVKLLLRVLIRAKHAGFHETAGDWMGLSRDAWRDRPLTLRLGSGSPPVGLRTLGRPVQSSTADLNLASGLQVLL